MVHESKHARSLSPFSILGKVEATILFIGLLIITFIFASIPGLIILAIATITYFVFSAKDRTGLP